MQRQNIRQIVVELFRENYRLYPEDYKEPGAAIIMAKEVAKGYWDNRVEFEIERDKKAQVTAEDYENWIVDELSEIVKETD